MEKNNSEYISLKQIILTIQEYAKAILNAWKLVIVVALIFAVLFSIRNHYDDDRYTAKLSYMLEDNEGANPASLTGLLGSFGFGSSKGLNRDKLVELSKSDLIISQTLLDKVVINGSTDFLGNHMVSIYGYDEVWAKKETNPLKDFRFRSDVLEDFGLNEHRALKQLKSRIIGSPSMGIEGVLTSGYNEDSGILKLTAVSVDPEFSIAVCNSLFHNLDSFFVFKTIERQKENYEVLKAKTDSLAALLEKTEYALAKFKDSERNLYRRVDRVEERRLENKSKMLYLALGKALENLEIADYSLKYQTPILSVIDQPHLPIGNAKKPLLIDLILGTLFGTLLSMVLIVLRKKYLEIMKD